MLRSIPLLLSLALALSGCDLSLSLDGKNGCSSDADCLGARVCEAHECVDRAYDNGGGMQDDGGWSGGGVTGSTTGGGDGDGATGASATGGGGATTGDSNGATTGSSNTTGGDVDGGVSGGAIAECSTTLPCDHGSCQDGICVTLVPKIITGDATWTEANSPYALSQDTQVGGILTIEPGVTVIGNSHLLRIFGGLAVRGSAAARVVFERVRISVSTDQALPGRLDIRFARFSGGTLYEMGSNAIYGSVRLRDSILEGTAGIYLYFPVADCSMVRNVFLESDGLLSYTTYGLDIRNNYFDVLTPTAYRAALNFPYSPSSKVVVQGNTFTNIGFPALALQDSGADVTATDNYWGTTSSAAIADRIWDKSDDLGLNVVIPYAPFLSTPDPLTPVPGGAWPVVDELDPCLGIGCECDEANPCYRGLNCVAHICLDESTTPVGDLDGGAALDAGSTVNGTDAGTDVSDASVSFDAGVSDDAGSSASTDAGSGASTDAGPQAGLYACDRVSAYGYCALYVGANQATEANLEALCSGHRLAACPTSNVVGHCVQLEGTVNETVTFYYNQISLTPSDCAGAGGRWY